MGTIGICEDDPALRRLLSRAVQGGDHEVLLAHNGAEALRVFAVDRGVDAIVMDIGLPDADGRDVCAALKSAGQHAPVLFLTALDAVQDRLAGFDAGGDDYVTKPFEIKEVLARLSVLVRRAPGGDTGASGLTLDPARHTRADEHRGGGADADGVPGPRGDRVPSRAGGAAPYGGRRRVVRRCLGQREQPRHVHAPCPGQAGPDRCAGAIATVRGVGYRLR